jgi:hypothetical protein
VPVYPIGFEDEAIATPLVCSPILSPHDCNADHGELPLLQPDLSLSPLRDFPHSGNLELRNATSYDLSEVVSRNADDRPMICYF